MYLLSFWNWQVKKNGYILYFYIACFPYLSAFTSHNTTLPSCFTVFQRTSGSMLGLVITYVIFYYHLFSLYQNSTDSKLTFSKPSLLKKTITNQNQWWSVSLLLLLSICTFCNTIPDIHISNRLLLHVLKVYYIVFLESRLAGFWSTSSSGCSGRLWPTYFHRCCLYGGLWYCNRNLPM